LDRTNSRTLARADARARSRVSHLRWCEQLAGSTSCAPQPLDLDNSGCEGILHISISPVDTIYHRYFCQAINQNDPTQTKPASFANLLGNFINNASPLSEAKKGLVSLLAGSYDVAATKAKLDALIQAEPVLMLSFTK
jgi:hypothetical protein